jgi:chemotaxis protein histidine kinase CheA/ActR/RegA family two-component response regulator
VELFLQETSEQLQLLREYGSVLLEPHPAPEDLERLYVAAHTLKGSSAMYGYPLFSELGAKLAHVFQYAATVGLSPEAAAPLAEFVSEAVAVLEADLLMVSDHRVENAEEIAAFKQKYPFAFQPEVEPATVAGPPPDAQPPNPPVSTPQSSHAPEAELPARFPQAGLPPHPASRDQTWLAGDPGWEEAVALPPDGEVGSEILEFFVPEAEEHLQTATACLLSLESNANPDDINRLFRVVHTLKGAAAQVGLSRIAWVAHRAEDLICCLRENKLPPDPALIDLGLDFLDVLKKLVYRQWPDEETVQRSVKTLIERIACLASAHAQEQGESRPEASDLRVPAAAAGPVATVAENPSPAAPPSDGGGCNVPAATAGEAAPAPEPAIPAMPSPPPAEARETDTAKPPDRVAVPLPEHPTSEIPESPALGMVATEDLPREQAAGFLSKSQPGGTGPIPKNDGRPVPEVAPAKKSPAVWPGRSVRIALERLDRMMNAVSGLVINRTRMRGRLAELEQLTDVLNFSKGRMADKIVEFQDKYEFSRLQSGFRPSSHAYRKEPAASVGQSPAWQFPYRSGYSSYAHAFDASLAEFSELEMDRYDDFSILARSLTEISADITEILSQLEAFARRADSDIDEYTKLAHRLEGEITEARRVPIGNLYTRLSRTMREAAKAVGKQIELELVGAETELDTNIVQHVADPLLHLVRNALAHGIESDEERYHLGKPDHGKIAVRAYRSGDCVCVEVEDDGRGIDWEKVRAAAVNLGFADAQEAANLTEAQLQDLLFRPGFSTVPQENELAGRGVGLDVVRTNVRALNGEIAIQTEKKLGTRFTLKLPLAMVISQALFVRAGKQVFAFPLASVDEIRRVRASEIEAIDGKLWTKIRDTQTAVLRLDRQLGLEPFAPVNGYHVLVLVNVAGRPAGIVVEEVLRKDEIVVKNLGEYLGRVKLFPGATIAPDGSLILLVDLGRLVAGETVERRPLMTVAPPLKAGSAQLFAPGMPLPAESGPPQTAADRAPDEKVVLLADDSISVRKFVGRMLEKAGYRVELAADGLEALEILGQTRCDLLVTDLEMPRSNGYELMAHLRQNPETRALPIVIVTSRAGIKHRDKALKFGVVDFLVKPVQEEQFIAAVRALIGPGTASSAGMGPSGQPEERA